MRAHLRLVLAYAALLHVETREAEYLFLEEAELLRRELTHKELLRKARVARVLRVVLNVVHALYEELFRDAKRVAKLKRVDASLCFVHHDHNVVSRLIVHEQSAVAVVDGTTRRVFDFLEEGVGVGVLLVVVAKQLQREETHDVDNDNSRCHESDYVAPFLKVIIAHFLLLMLPITTNNVLYLQFLLCSIFYF